MSEAARKIIDLLNYIEQVEKLKSRPAFSIPTEFLAAYQSELESLPELRFNLQEEGDDVWLRVPRLQEISPPEPEDVLKPWVTISKSPAKIPELKSVAEIGEPGREMRRFQLDELPEIRGLFAWYMEFLWQPWANAEIPRRKSVARYNQLFSFQQAIASEGTETALELAWGIGYTVWKKEGFGTPVRYPLIIQSCEISLNESTFDIEVRPRDAEARLELDCYAEMEIAGVKQLEDFWRSALASGANRVNPFEPSTFEGTLKAAVGHLDATGGYRELAPGETPPAPGANLLISNTWVVFGRKRSGDIFLEDIRRLKKHIADAKELPPVICGFVEPGDDTIRVRPEQAFRGLSSSSAGPGAMELYFPMPYNDEQVSIVQKLHSNEGMVVQGPPGTGKTHTIANVICHYLALGKRVLVTAKGEQALAVLQEKLPERIRPLSVALLSGERDGMKQFEHAIQTIASSVAALNPDRAMARIAAGDEMLNQLHAKIAHVDQSVAAYAARHMQRYPFRGRELTPEELARLVLNEAEAHEWFDDEPTRNFADEPSLTEADIASLRRARMRVGPDLRYAGSALPAPGVLPSWTDVLGLHRDLVKARSIDASVTRGDLFPLIDARLETFEKAQALAAFLDERLRLKARIAGSAHRWIDGLGKRLRDMVPTDPALQGLLELCADVRRLERTRLKFVVKALDVPETAELNPELVEAVERLFSGKTAFALPFGRTEARKFISAIRITGIAPASREDWETVSELLNWRIEAKKALTRWTSLSPEFNLEIPGAALDGGFKALVQWQASVEDLRRMIHEYDAQLHSRLAEVFGKPMADKVWESGEPIVARAAESLTAHIDRGRLGYAMKQVQELMRQLDGHSGAVVEEFRSFFSETLGRSTVDEGVLHTTWRALEHELNRLGALADSLSEVARVAALVEAAGAKKWAQRILQNSATEDMDSVLPPSWADAWHWRQALMFLEQIDGRHQLRGLFEERRALAASLSATYQEMVAEKTWLGVFNNSPDSVRQALQAYLNAVNAMGTGKGIRAVRHRKTAQEAMLRAYQAVPCWVLPQWRVSEALPAKVGLFDLVIIDEASQSDIWALPALLRGKKLLVVGDHKQVSPSAVGMAEQRIVELINRFLADQPHGSEMTPDKSIYDLAQVVFAGNSVMLKEHFRCVPAIIEFSNREFYENDIRPLRVPKANERLDPPLIDVFVKGGHRQGDINKPEAKAIVDELETIIADSQFAGRTLGVVTLLGTQQAAHIHDLVSQRISPIDIVARKIAVGPPPVFQGGERDIMLVSMVLGPGDRAAASRADMHQRFNVALSRARDRMYLFRSVLDNEFAEDSLNGRVIRHFRQPFRQEARKLQALRDRCQSGFEREMFDELVKRGYRVEPQLPSGGYFIDFVVEGNEGRRLAIECDGDRFHGPGQWQADMARQRVLERAGWTFWRCFASSFVRRRKEVIDDLLKTLNELGIEPLGAETVDNTVWVHHKEVDPYSVEEAEEIEQ